MSFNTTVTCQFIVCIASSNFVELWLLNFKLLLHDIAIFQTTTMQMYLYYSFASCVAIIDHLFLLLENTLIFLFLLL